MQKKKTMLTVLLLGAFLFGFAVWGAIKPADAQSQSERRSLTQFPASRKPRSVTTELEASDRLLTASAVMETLLQSVPTTSFPANSKRLQKMPVMPASFPYCVRTAGFRVSV